VCIRKPGAALTSTIAPPVSRTGVAMSGQMKSIPATSSPTIWAAVSAISTLSGWASNVRSIDVPPVDLDSRQNLHVADASARVLVGDVDELADGVLPVGDDARRDSLGDRRDLSADHEAAVVVAGDVALDDEIAGAALREGGVERFSDGLVRTQVEVDAAAVVAVERLDDARKTDTGRGGGRLVFRPHDGAARDRQSGRIEQSVRQALVRCDVDPDRRCLRRHRRPDALLVDALAELHEGVAIEPDVGDVAARRLIEDRLGAWAECLALGEQDEPLELAHEVDRDRWVVRGDEVIDEGNGDLAGLDPDVLLAVLVNDVVAAVLAGAARLAVADVRAGEVLELERDVLGDVAHPRAVAEPRDEPAAPAEAAGVVLEARQQADKSVCEARDLVRREVLKDAEIDDHPDDRLAGPVVRAAEDPRLDDLEGGLGAAAAGPVRGAALRRRARRRIRAGRCRRRLPGPRFRCRLRHSALLPRAHSYVRPECTRPTRAIAVSRSRLRDAT
jgi:hypothetical protein